MTSEKPRSGECVLNTDSDYEIAIRYRARSGYRETIAALMMNEAEDSFEVFDAEGPRAGYMNTNEVGLIGDKAEGRRSQEYSQCHHVVTT